MAISEAPYVDDDNTYNGDDADADADADNLRSSEVTPSLDPKKNSVL